MSGLVGESHQAALATLIESYQRVNVGIGSADAGGPMVSELVVLSAPMGWGKTRVVQEFYAHLADTQPEDGRYWPPALVADIDRGPVLNARKKVEPGTFQVAATTDLPYLWWGLSCQERQDARLANVVADDVSQLVAHLGPALARLESSRATRQAALGLARTLSAAAPFSDVPGMLDSLANLGASLSDLLKGLRDRRTDTSEVRTVDPDQTDGSLMETWVGALGSLLRRAEVPLIVLIDDAHWADTASIEFFDEVLKSVPCLMVFTAWPDQLRIQERNDRSSDAGGFVDRWRDRLSICEIDRPNKAAAVELTASALGVEETHPLAAQLADRADGNPLVLRLWAEVPLVQSAALTEELLDPQELSELPQDARAEFQRRWRDLPAVVQTVLAPAALHGSTFVPAMVSETLAAVGLLPKDDSDQALAEADDPHLWIRNLVADTCQFTEPLLQEIAERQCRETLTANQRRELNTAFSTSLGLLRQSGEWTVLSATGRRALLVRHLRLAQEGEGGDPTGVVATYWELADLQPESHVGWNEALALVSSAIELSEDAKLGGGSRLTARLAGLLVGLGRADEALPVCEQALADSERLHDSDHRSTFTLRHNVARCLEAAGRFSDALPLYEQTLADRERVLGPDHPSTVTCRNHLAGCLRQVGRVGDALRLCEQVLADQEKVLGPDHPETLESRNNLALCLGAVGRSGDALPLLDQNATDRERVLGTDHPAAVAARNNLANCLLRVGRAGDAIVLFEQTLRGGERVFGTDHPDTLAARNNLANCLLAVGHASDALPLLERNVTDSERVLGTDHPDTLTCRNNLAGCLGLVGRDSDALPLLEQTLADSQRVLGPDHPDTLGSRNNLAGSLETLGRSGDALPHHERTVTDSQRVLGNDHPDTLTCRNNLACCLLRVGRTGDALLLLEPILTDRERVLGADHPDTLTSLNNLAGCLQGVGRAGDALPLFERALKGMERVLGADHPNSVSARDNLAGCLRAVGRTDDTDRVLAGECNA